jgi:hypothetical protein
MMLQTPLNNLTAVKLWLWLYNGLINNFEARFSSCTEMTSSMVY